VDLSQDEWENYTLPLIPSHQGRGKEKRNTHQGKEKPVKSYNQGIPLPLWEGVRGRGIYTLK
jgi:hypothetical protein